MFNIIFGLIYLITGLVFITVGVYGTWKEKEINIHVEDLPNGKYSIRANKEKVEIFQDERVFKTYVSVDLLENEGK